MKKSKGITLVALVITIILLLILSGITIQALTGTGLFENAKQASKESKYAAAAEKVALAVNASYDETGKLNDNQLKTNLNKIEGIYPKVEEISYDLEVIVDGYKFKISKTGKITGEKTQLATLPENTPNTNAGTEVRPAEGWETETVEYIKTADGTKVETLEKVSTVYAISVGNGEKIPVPKEFVYVGGTIESGIVISDDKRDQNKYAGQPDVPAGVKYNEDGTVKTYTEEQYNQLSENEKKELILGNQFVWIPCNIENYTKYNWGYYNNSWVKTTYTAEKGQIKKYGGFYVGRYEAGTSKIKLKNNGENEVKFDKGEATGWYTSLFTSTNVQNGEITSKAGEIPYYHSDYTTAEEMAERMYSNNKYIDSGLMTGTMWDVMINYMSNENEANKSITNANNGNYYKDIKSESYWGNYNSNNENVKYKEGQGRYITVSDGSTSSAVKSDNDFHYGIRTTASTEDVKKKNLYDIAGNLWEWTQEDVSDQYYMLRGGSFYDAYASNPACYRGYVVASGTNTDHGFRVALYIK